VICENGDYAEIFPERIGNGAGKVRNKIGDGAFMVWRSFLCRYFPLT
jgi:hypothetical protein